LAHRDAAAVVDHADAAVGHQRHLDVVGIAREGLVDRVVDDLLYEMVQAALTGRTDVHARALANRLKSFKDSDRTSVVRQKRSSCRGCLPLRARGRRGVPRNTHEGTRLCSVSPWSEPRAPFRRRSILNHFHSTGRHDRKWHSRALCARVAAEWPWSHTPLYDPGDSLS